MRPVGCTTRYQPPKKVQRQPTLPMSETIFHWPPPAQPGDSIDDIDTPALLVDLDRLERNLVRMAGFAAQAGVRLRPHAKMHKTPAVARRQIALGAVGVCCQKVSEAEAMADGGIQDVLLSNEVVGRKKIDRLAALAQRIRIGVCVDHADNLRELNLAAGRAGVRLDVYVEINAGANRCGVESGEPALVLARLAAALPHLQFKGLQVYHGSAQHLRTADERRRAIEIATSKAALSRDLISGAGIPCPVITGAGTGTFELEAASQVFNELQPGSYAFMDADYGRNEATAPFEQSLTILTTVMSHAADRVVVDCGLKAHSVDSGMPLVVSTEPGYPSGLTYLKASDEHGVIVSKAHATLPTLGTRLQLIPGHVDPTVNLHDWILGMRNGVVEEIWPVTARGAMW